MKESHKKTELAEVCKAIAAQMGLHFPVERWNILERNLAIASHEFGFEHFDEFIHWLSSTVLEKDQIKILASYLTISESYFWRETPVFTALTSSILPEILASKKGGEKIIRIWSAGCSTGEEAYSIAMALHRTIPDIKDWNILILATDINSKSLSKARAGIYSQWSFRNCPLWLRSSYFKPLENGHYEIRPEIKKMVTFSNLNLAKAIYPSPVTNTHSMDLIFCRNVLMYFTDEWINEISSNLSLSLNQNGWLAVASCELSSQLFPNFTSVNFPGAVIYHKSPKEFSTFKVIPPFDFIPAQTTFQEIPVLNSIVAESAAVSFGIPEETRQVVLTLSDTNTKDSLHVSEEGKGSVTDADLTLMIRLLADAGNLDEALILCNDSIESDKLTLPIYFLKASILQELDRIDEAISSLKQAIYLDPDFVMGHFVIGNLYLRQGNMKNAKRHFDNVLNILPTYSDETILPESEGLSAKYIREIIFANR